MNGRLLSIVVAVYFEEDCVEQFILETTGVLEREGVNYEIVFVDDGSRDRTVELIKAAAARNDRLKLVELSYNHGKQGAVTAGIAHASGDLILMMDPDLQDPPEEIPHFLTEIEKGYDLVFGVRAERHDSWLNKLFSRVFWWVLARFTGLELPVGLAVMRIFDRRFADQFLRYGEQNRFIEGIFMHVGMRWTSIEIAQRPRFAGYSKFNFRRKMDLAFTAILDFSDLPLRLTTRCGVFLVAGGFVLVGFLILQYLFLNRPPEGWPSILAAVVITSGLQIFFMGVVGQYVGRIYRETKQRPLYSVKATTNLAESAASVTIAAK